MRAALQSLHATAASTQNAEARAKHNIRHKNDCKYDSAFIFVPCLMQLVFFSMRATCMCNGMQICFVFVTEVKLPTC
jgi:hypothetical protein